MVPKLLIVAGNRVDPNVMPGFTPLVPMPGCPYWYRSHWSSPDATIVRWWYMPEGTSLGYQAALVDVFNRRADAPLELVVDGVPDRVWPLSGRAFSSGPPESVVGNVSAGSGDGEIAKLLAKDPIDYPETGEHGSPRNFEFDPIEIHARRDGGLSPVALEYFDKWAAFQVRRPVQSRDGFGLPLAFAGEGRSLRAPAPKYGVSPFPGVEFLEPHDNQHFTIERLAAIFRTTRSPRALDQLVATLLHALDTEFYWQPPFPTKWGLAPRSPARLLTACHTAFVTLALVGGPLYQELAPRIARRAKAVIDKLNALWTDDVWHPLATTYTGAGHTALLHSPAFENAHLLMAARRWIGLLPGAGRIAAKTQDWIERFAWDRLGSVGGKLLVYYDVVAPGAGEQPAGKEPDPGVAGWVVGAMIGTGGEFERRAREAAIATKCWNAPESYKLGWWGETTWPA